MNKRTLNRIIKLMEDGMGRRDAIKLIIELSKNSGEAADLICQEFLVTRRVAR